MTIEELLLKLNENKEDIYELSEAAGFSRTTLRKRLMEFGFVQIKDANGIRFVFNGEGQPPLTEQIDHKNRKRKTPNRQINTVTTSNEIDLFTAFLQLPIEEKKVTTSFKTDEKLIQRMKDFTKITSLPQGRIYSLAIHEFLEKYEPQIKK